ncbi:MAG TPA: hypothetical protein VNA22_04590 [Pyrinomonadaceae bacterium]|nr:hypothetical protein [Pyrinomonadaceae bacterium]
MRFIDDRDRLPCGRVTNVVRVANGDNVPSGRSATPIIVLSPTATNIKAEGAASETSGTLGWNPSDVPSLKATNNLLRPFRERRHDRS